LEVIHSDVGGPVSPKSRDGKRYWISEALNNFLEWADDVQAYFKMELGTVNFSQNFQKLFQTDGGGEYFNKVFSAKL
ncbi:hypothetical protein M422DRAFT_124028, partial [Sphaerobolus stellatus SS14]